jgi:hypothetical protein
MDVALLTRVSPKASLIEALEAIRSGTSAVVVEDEEPYLVTADDIMAVSNEVADSDKVAKPESTPVGVVPRKGRRFDATAFLAESLGSIASLDSLGGIAGLVREGFKPFAPNDDRYMVLPNTLEWMSAIYANVLPHIAPGRSVPNGGHTSGAFVVVTASESYFQVGQGVTICTCVGNPVHRFSQKELRVPGKCNKPHGVIVNCKTV